MLMQSFSSVDGKISCIVWHEDRELERFIFIVILYNMISIKFLI